MINPSLKLISRQDAAFIIIDMQERLLPVIYNGDKVLENVLKLIRFARIIDMPVLVSEQDKLGATVPEIKEKLASLEPVKKVEFDACQNPGFMERVGKLDKDCLILSGIESHICVTQTVLHLLPRYTIHVISDAVSSRSPDDRRVALERMRLAGAVISSTEMVIYELLGKAGTEEFKAALRLVK